MTVLTKPHLSMKKPEIIKVPLVEICEEDPPATPPIQYEWVGPKQSSPALMYLSFTVMLMIMGLTTGFLVYRQNMKPSHRYQGYCTIPMPMDLKNSEFMEPSYRVLPVRWTSDPDVQVLSTVDDNAGEEIVNTLREELDIGDTVEKIAVIDNGRRVNFIHDFTDNTTGIMDADRCFVMEMEPSVVVSPAALAAGLSAGAAFDVSRVRSALRAALPALQALAHAARIAAACAPRPLYRLQRDQPGVRKRSAEDPPHDYIQFSGKHVQEIKINNMQEILDYEKQIKRA